MDSELPAVEAIMEEIRRGLADTTLSNATAAAAAVGSLTGDLRQASSTAGVLGRCGGSLRGRICRLLAPLALPVVEQLDLFHAAVVAALSRLAGQTAEQDAATARMEDLERRLSALEAGLKGGTKGGVDP